MTYKKSSVSKAVKSDFIGCLKTTYLFPLISAIITLFLGLIEIGTTMRESKTMVQQILFGNELIFNSTMIIYLVTILTGIITGIRAFAFLRKVPSTNVYLSLPITRYDLYANRVFASIIYFVGASVLPILILCGLNYAFFKPESHFIQVCVYYMAYSFVAYFLGFALSSLVSVAVGKTSEARFFSLVLLFTPAIILKALDKLQSAFFNGAAVDGFSSYARSSIFDFSEKISDKFNFLNPFSVMIENSDLQVLLVGEKFKGFNFNDHILPLIIFAIFALVITVITPAFLEKRLAESADSVGVSKGLTIFTSGLFAFIALSLIPDLPPFMDKISLTIFAIIASIIIYFITYAILTRNKKKIVKCLKLLPVVAVCSIALICATVGFGKLYYSKVPNVDDINCAYAVASGSDIVFKTTTSNTSLESVTTHDTLIGKMTDKDDLKLLTDVHKQVTKELYKGDGTFKVVYIMNDGTAIARSYYNVGADAAKQTYKLYDTKAYNDMLKYYLTVDEETYNMDSQRLQDEINKLSSTQFDSPYIYNETHINYNILNLKRKQFRDNALLTNNLMYLTDKNGVNSKLITNKIDDDEISELRLHLYNDISKMTYEQKDFNQGSPLYYISFARLDDFVDYTLNVDKTGEETLQPVTPETPPIDINQFSFKLSIPVFESMTETLSFLADKGLFVNNISTDNIVKGEYYEAKGRFDHKVIDDLYLMPDYQKIKDNTFYAESKSQKLLDFYSGIGYVEYDNVTNDKVEIEQLYNASKPNYSIVGDNGLIARFTTESGIVFTAYIPESNIPEFTK